jgi:hypothetical protein
MYSYYLANKDSILANEKYRLEKENDNNYIPKNTIRYVVKRELKPYYKMVEDKVKLKITAKTFYLLVAISSTLFYTGKRKVYYSVYYTYNKPNTDSGFLLERTKHFYFKSLLLIHLVPNLKEETIKLNLESYHYPSYYICADRDVFFTTQDYINNLFDGSKDKQVVFIFQDTSLEQVKGVFK